MMPSYFERLAKMPLTSNGKVDRKALAVSSQLPESKGRINTGVEYVAPENEIQKELTEVWGRMLGVEKVGINDNFFYLGGDSIKALQVMSRLTNYKVDLSELFKYPTIAELSKYVKTVCDEINQDIVEGEIALTPIQKWFFEQRSNQKQHFNQSVLLYRVNGFNENHVQSAFSKIIERHDALRMTYQIKEQNIVQINQGFTGEPLDLKVFDFSPDRDYECRMEVEADLLQESIDLQNGPLVKLAIFKTNKGDFLLIVIHHLITDGVSWRVLLEDFALAYQQKSDHHEIILRSKTHSFKEWSDKLGEYSSSKELQNEIHYWSDLEKQNIKPFSKDRVVQERKSKTNQVITIALNEAETNHLLNNVNNVYNTEINDILLAALGMAFKEWSANDKILLDLEGHGREEILPDFDISRTVGWFTTLYPVILDMSESANLPYLIKTVKEDLRRIPNHGIGYGILKYLTLDRDSNPVEI